MSNDLLFELGAEELPSAAVWSLANELANNICAALAKAKLAHGNVYRYATPRRLAVMIEDVQATQESQTISRRGPAAAAAVDAQGQPTPALLGFAKSCGVAVADLTTMQTDKGEWWVYEAAMPGASTLDLLPAMITEAVKNLAIAKPMRWGSGDVEFARPVHWAVLLYGNQVVNTTVLGINTGGESVGHRFHHPHAIEITNPRIYAKILKDAYVIADFATRRQMIVDQVQQLATARGFTAVMPDALVDEVTSIVEWPQPLLVDFANEFLEVPAEALIAAMQVHQKCFALCDKHGKLVPHFITVANIQSSHPQQVIAGNEKVMRARLSDAAFFYRQDKKQRLSDYAAATAQVVFQARLGSLHDKAMRMQALMASLGPVFSLDSTQAARAAALSKCDLMTGMVGEFPELQGLMGSYYARHDGEDDSVAQALNEQYMPRFAADQLPQSSLGLALSLADRLDTLVGNFAIGQKPTGVKDPFKLRRHALAVVRLLLATPATLKLSTLINQTMQTYGDSLVDAKPPLAELQTFILERMQSYYQGQGVAPDLVHAVRAREDDCLVDIDKRINALLAFISMPEASSLSAACKRVNNLLQHVSTTNHALVNPDLLVEAAEKALFDHVQLIEQRVQPLYSSGDYGNILNELASLRAPVDTFFDQVMVMADNQVLKDNRLSLLSRLQNLLRGVADISLLQLGS